MMEPMSAWVTSESMATGVRGGLGSRRSSLAWQWPVSVPVTCPGSWTLPSGDEDAADDADRVGVPPDELPGLGRLIVPLMVHPVSARAATTASVPAARSAGLFVDCTLSWCTAKPIVKMVRPRAE